MRARQGGVGRILERIVELWREGGIPGVVARIQDRLSDTYQERRLGIESARAARMDELGIDDERCLMYTPTKFRDFREIMRRIAIREDRDVFIDFGSGKGRVVIMAGTYPFRRVLGVEVSEALNRVAAQNVERAKPRLRCREIELVTANATEFEIPPDASVFYFYSPFRGDILRAVLDKIRASVVAHPRSARLVYKNTAHFDREIGPCDWLVETERFACGGHSCAILEVRP